VHGDFQRSGLKLRFSALCILLPLIFLLSVPASVNAVTTADYVPPLPLKVGSKVAESSSSILLLPSSPSGVYASSSSGSLTGTQKVLVLTVQFTDLSHSTTGTVEETVSDLSKYWQDVSYGKISLAATFSAKWYTLTQTHAYYGANPETSSRKIELIQDAVSVASGDFSFGDFSFLTIVHAGDSEGHSMKAADIWSAGTIGRGTVTTSQGSFLLGVSIVAERDPVGAYAHELGHNFGLPDLWDYKIASSSCPWCDTFVGEWDLMAHGCWSGNGTTPARLTSWSLMKLGWLDDSAVTVVKAGDKSQQQLRPLASATPSVVKVTITESTYYLVEAREKTGWDRNLPDEGLLIFYVDDRKGSGEGPVRYKGPSNNLNKAWKANEFFVDEANQLIVATAVDTNFQITTYGASASGTFDVTINAPYPDLPIVFDGKEYRTSQGGGVVISSVTFGAHNVTTQGIHMVDRGVRGAFSAWSDGDTSNPRTLVVLANMNVTAIYKTQFLLTLVSDVPVNGSGWYDAGSKAPLKVEQYVDYGNGTRRAFTGWSGDYTETSPSAELVMDTPKTVTANWAVQYQLTILSDYGSPEGAGWYNAHEAAQVSVASTVDVSSGARVRFLSWTGDASRTETTFLLAVDKPKTLKVNWQLQHLVSINFVDGNGQSLANPPPKLVFTYGTSQLDLQGGGEVWLDAGNYTLDSAWWHGVDIAIAGAKYVTSPNAVWQIPLHVYSVTVNVRSIITGLPASHATVTLILADGEALNATTNMEGVVVFSQVPGGESYPVKTTVQYLPHQFTVTVESKNAEVTVKVPVPLELGIIAGLVVVAVLIAFLKRRRGAEAKERLRRKRRIVRRLKSNPLRNYLKNL